MYNICDPLCDPYFMGTVTFAISSLSPLKISLHGISRSPCGRSAEYRCESVILHLIVLISILKNNEQAAEINLGT